MRITNIICYFHTLRYLKLSQVFYRIWFKLAKPRISRGPAPRIRENKKPWYSPIIKPYCKKDNSLFTFLNVTYSISSNTVWNDKQIEKLWLYNLHYFDLLSSEVAKDTAFCCQHIERWIKENPPVSGTGWEPYPLSLRIVNWIKWHLGSGQLSSDAIYSLCLQVRCLNQRLEFHLLGNHLLANIKALVFAGLFFEGNEAQGWLKKGLALLTKQIKEQILLDGGHFELSPMYHAIILEDFLDIINLYSIYSLPPPEAVIAVVPKMVNWLSFLTHPDGGLSFFNDSALGIAPNCNNLSCYAARLGFANFLAVNMSDYFPQSGYARLTKGKAIIIADAGNIGPDYLPGHAHADTLSFEMSLESQRIFVNSGTSCYGLSNERLRQRRTLAHNTATVDDTDSSEVWSSFRVARRARIKQVRFEQFEDYVLFEAQHTGYERLTNPVIHKRCFLLSEHQLQIKDSFLGLACHKIKLFLHLHPALEVFEIGARQVKIILPSMKEVTVNVDKEWKMCIEPSTYHPEFGKSLPNKKLIIAYDGKLPVNSVITCLF